MELKRQIYYLKRIKELGILNTIKRAGNRLNRQLYKFSWKQKALNLKANHSWKQIKTKNKISKEFNQVFIKLKEKKFIEHILNSQEFKNFTKHLEPTLLEPIYTFDWHIEFKDKKNYFYQDIKINFIQNPILGKLSPDIKTPWELSRFQHIFSLGQKYQETSDPKFTKIFQEQINGWISNNPFLLGVNWVCPMEVGIRAINLIYGFNSFKNSTEISLAFWEKFVCSLYDHAKYLEHNWETSDKPNNHYLADLIGYFYLCFFFEEFKHFRKAKEKIYREILSQFEKQVHQDGTCYEGSTSYHKLVTEIFLHFYLLCKTNNIPLPENFYTKLKKMFLFLQNCTDQADNLVQIGDNDSGKILNIPFVSLDTRHFMAHSGRTVFQNLITQSKKNIFTYKIHRILRTYLARSSRVIFEPQPGEKNRIEGYDHQNILSLYPNFGLSIIKNEKFHITFRHPTFNSSQPSGHFHQDALSVTLSINGIPVLIDPGTYVYTANAAWRNFFRSSENHNTFSLKTTPNFDDLFQLKLTEQTDTAKILNNKDKIEIENHCNNFFPLGLTQHRKLIFSKQKQTVELQDWWQDKTTQTNSSTTNSAWTLIFHPNITIKQFSKNIWTIKHKNLDFAKLESNLEFKKTEGFYSKKYGKIEKCIKLEAVKKIDNQKNFIKLNAV